MENTTAARKNSIWIKFGKVCYITSLILILAALAVSASNAALSDALFIAFWVGFFCGTIGFYNNRENVSVSAAAQMSTICAFIMVFWLCTIRECVVHHANVHYPIAVTGALSLVGSTVLWTIALFQRRSRSIGTSIGAFLKQNSYVFIVFLLFFIGYLECFTFLFKSDSYIYYSTIQLNEGRWTFSLSDISKFQIGYHSTYGYSLFAFLANYVVRIYGIGVRLANLCIIGATLLCLNDILRQLFPNKKKLFYALLLLIFVFNPLYMGLAQEMNTDMPLACFFIWFVWAFMRRKRVFSLVFACLLCFTKENAVVVLFGYMAGIYLYRLFRVIRGRNFKLSSFLTVIEAREWWIVIAPVLFGINMLLYNNWHLGETVAAVEVTDPNYVLVNSFQINLPYIWIKLRQIFVMNFQWLAIPLAILGCFLLFKSAGEKRERQETDIGITVSFILYLAFQLVFLTYPHYRYLIPSSFYFTCLAGAVLSKLKSRPLCNTVLAAVAGLLLVQSFYSIDPLTNKNAKMVSTGNGQIISEGYYGSVPESPYHLALVKDGGDMSSEYFRDYVQNNRQYLGFERCFEKFMREIDYSQDIGIVISPIFSDGYWGDDRWTCNNMLGTWEMENIHWNSRLGQLTFEDKDSFIRWVINPVSEAQFDSCSEVWYIELPYKPEWDYEGFLAQFDVQEEKQVQWGQWSFNAYRVELAE